VILPPLVFPHYTVQIAPEYRLHSLRSHNFTFRTRSAIAAKASLPSFRITWCQFYKTFYSSLTKEQERSKPSLMFDSKAGTWLYGTPVACVITIL
jgi:hypothetical protein